MITKVTHASVFVLNQDSAYDFYVNKLGFEVRQDNQMGPDFRWLTVGPKEQPDFELIILPVKEGSVFKKDKVSIIKDLIEKGTFGGLVMDCTDIYATYEELKQKGVEFSYPPKKQIYGRIDTTFKDDSGNWISLGQNV
jgi:catechol 2,3-dioxygenase-like lactoylglutathione lyase family enzyme